MATGETTGGALAASGLEALEGAARPEVLLAEAVVVRVEGEGAVLLEAGSRTVTARLAFDLLVAPEPGDRVLFCERADERHVLRILARVGGERTLRVGRAERDLHLAGRTVTAEAAERLSLVAPVAHVATGAFSVVARLCTLVGERLAETFRRRDETTGERVVVTDCQREHHGQRHVHVEGIDDLAADTKVERVEGVAFLRSASVVTTAEDDIRMDAERVTMG